MSETKSSNKDWKEYLKDFENLLDEYLGKKAPSLPENIKEIIVKFSPYLTLIVIVMMAPILLAALGLGAAFMPFSYLGGLRMGFGYTFSLIWTVLALILEVIALPGLFKRAKSAWYLVYYASLVSLVQGVFSGNLVGSLVGTLISMYVLFQIKSYYK